MLDLLFIFFCFSSGLVISGAVYAFIVIIGIIPTIINVTKTKKNILLYENVIVFAGILGTIATFFEVNLFLSEFILVIIGFSWGIFIGCLTVSLAETLDGIPVISRRLRINCKVSYFIYALAIAKTVGTLMVTLSELFKNL